MCVCVERTENYQMLYLAVDVKTDACPVYKRGRISVEVDASMGMVAKVNVMGVVVGVAGRDGMDREDNILEGTVVLDRVDTVPQDNKDERQTFGLAGLGEWHYHKDKVLGVRLGDERWAKWAGRDRWRK